MFRATHIINIYKKYGLELVSKELNHSRLSTTEKYYIKAEDRDLFLNEEKDLFGQEYDDISFGNDKEINANNKKDIFHYMNLY